MAVLAVMVGCLLVRSARIILSKNFVSEESKMMPKTSKLDDLLRQQSDIRAALKEIQKRRRAQERTDRLRLEAEIGAALLADAEASDTSARRAYISEVLDRMVTNETARAFLRSKKWLT
jgi:hypothetical protein